ncbi:hypothetical protein KUCAC02_023345, partial [Chaenocephalus aceratus]
GTSATAVLGGDRLVFATSRDGVPRLRPSPLTQSLFVVLSEALQCAEAAQWQLYWR